MQDLTLLEYLIILFVKIAPFITASCLFVGIITAIDNYTEKKAKEKAQRKAAAIQREKELAAARKKMIEMLKNI